jgi:dolichol-phosphate mannosyltransferase
MARAYFVLMIYNEEDAIPNVVKSIMSASLPPHLERRILAVNDGSIDSSKAILAEMGRSYPVHTLSFEERQGMPLSFKAAFNHLKQYLEDGDLVFTMEADATNDIACVPHMAEAIEKGADVVIASRYAPGAASLGFPWYRLIGSRVINLFLSLMWNIPHVKDYSVLYRAYRGSTLKKYINEDNEPFRARKSFAVISEILLRISHYTSKFAEVPLRYDYGLKKGKSKMKLLQTLWEYTRVTPRIALYRQPLFWIAIGAFFLRIWGITYGFPDLLVLDEPALTRGALTMLKLHTLIPALHPADFATMYYPPLTAYLYVLVLAPVMGLMYLFSHAPSLGAYATELVLDPTPAWIVTRAISALTGALTVYFIGRLAERMYKGSGIFAALFLATSFLHVEFSHIARHWSLSYLWMVALLWAAYRIYNSGQKRWYVLAGIFGGLGVMTGVLGGILMVAPALAHFFRDGSFMQKLRSAGFWIMIGITGALTALTFALHPLILSNLLESPEHQGITLTASKSLYGFANMAITMTRDFAQTETIIFIFGFIGLSFFLLRHRKFGAVLALSAGLTVLSLYLFHYYLLHYVSLILPIFVLFAAVGAYEIVQMAKGRFMRAAIVVAIFLLPTLVALRFSYLWTLPDTRHDARAYIEKSLPQQARIISYMPNMKVVTPEKNLLRERLAFDPASSRLVDQTLLSLATSSYPSPAYPVFETGTLSSEGAAKMTPQFLASQHFDYVVVDRFNTPYPALEALLSIGEIVARFPASGPALNILDNDFGGPSIAVFSMKQMGPEVWVVKLNR